MILIFTISIHASTWEAARGFGLEREFISNFNSRLYMRGSVHTNVPISGTSYFNSRLYMRGSKGVHLFGEYMNISIHASTWEAAWAGREEQRTAEFQFTPLHERQPLVIAPCHSLEVFQFTPLHERQREQNVVSAYVHKISIHASTWEAAISSKDFLRPSIFQFTPLHERQL